MSVIARLHAARLATLVLVGAATLAACNSTPYQFTTAMPTAAQQAALHAVSDLALVKEVLRRHAATPAAIDTLDDAGLESVARQCKQSIQPDDLPVGTCAFDAYTAVLMTGAGVELVRSQRFPLGGEGPDPWQALYWMVEVLGQRGGPSAMEIAVASLDPNNIPSGNGSGPIPIPPAAVIDFRDHQVPPFIAAAQPLVQFHDAHHLSP
jgi:hypothetical protein